MRLLTIIISLVILLSAPCAMAVQKLEATDDRIKTLVYDPSEVFRVVSRAGFQTTIEFNKDETIDTISIGDSIGWQLTPAGKRLFIKPLHKSGITNLSVITNRRSYQFELLATSSTSLNSSHSYVVKFYYPDTGSIGMNTDPAQADRTRGSLRPVGDTTIPNIPAPYVPPAPILAGPLPGEMHGSAIPMPQQPMPPQQLMAPQPMAPQTMAPQPIAQQASAPNYNYTMSGPDSIAPVKIYDNGVATYFQFPGKVGASAKIAVVGADGTEYPLTTHSEKGMVVVDAVAAKMRIKKGKDTVYVYNESKPAGY